MEIKNLFDTNKDIYRTIEKVITYGASQQARLKAEISEYVVTESIEEQFEKLLGKMQAAMEAGGENEVGVWVSGFYGSGKSSFTKYLGLAFDENVTIDGIAFIQHLQDRLKKSTTRALLNTIARRFPAAVLMLDLASEQVAGSTMEEVSTVLYYKVLQWAGYSRNLKVAAFERKLKKEDRYNEFLDLFKTYTDGQAWVNYRNDDLVVDSLIPEIAHQIYPSLFKTPASFSTETSEVIRFENDRVEEMLEIAREATGKEHIIFIIDEVGQYVGSKKNLILNLDGLAKNLKNIGNGKVWIIGTAQQTLTEDDPNASLNSPELYKLKDRFPIQIDLEANDIKEICYSRLLGKSPAGENELGELFDKHGQMLRHNTKLVDARVYGADFDRKTFIDLYPFLPAHFDILLHLLGALAKRTGGIGLRSAIKVIQDILVEGADSRTPVADQPVGWLATTVTIYDTLEKDIRREFASYHQSVGKVVNNRFHDSIIHQDIAKTVCVLQILGNLPVSAENVAGLMHSGISDVSCLDQVKVAVEDLINDPIVPFGEQDGQLCFFSEKLNDIEQERATVPLRPVELRRIQNEALKEIFSPLPSTQLAGSLSVQTGLKALSSSGLPVSIAGDRNTIQTFIEIVDPKAYDTTKIRLTDESRHNSAKHHIFLVGQSTPEMEEQINQIYRSREIVSKYRSEPDQEVKEYCNGQANRANRLMIDLERLIKRSLLQGSFIFKGEVSAVESIHPELIEACRRHLSGVAEQVFDRYAEAPYRGGTDLAEKFLRLGNLTGVTSQTDPLGLVQTQGGRPSINTDHKAVTSIRDMIERQGAIEGKRLIEIFTGAPFGWSQDTLRYLVAAMLVAGEIKLKVAGREVTVKGQHAIDALKTNNTFKSVGISLRDERPSMEILAKAADRLTELSGTIADPETLTFLDNQGEQTALILRETLTHYLTTIPGKSQNTRTSQTLDRIIREQAFTVLNRLSALRMAGARGFLIESIANGYSSKGFQLYKNLAGTALGKTEQTVTGDTYRQYLFSLFDEFSGELPVLFDRYSIQGRLFPRESALLALLEQINHFEIEHLWAEDETIGWIYQYFNSQEERKKMRAESQAPRNSRELAVRNQFFTPRYVVEFLTDNTLGRIWYEMTQGKTSLVGSCRYLVRRPNEFFLAKGEEAPDTDEEAHESLSQEELLKQPVYIPFRALKDPRNIRMLDPACGSMHFGLYAFDLFEKIYKEAWQLETELGPNKLERPKKFKPLQDSFANFEEFQKAIPKLILEHNIHGVDIDPRAVQIAGLSLWQRAHRAWHQMGIKPSDRPMIRKSNIVCAEPMPGDKEILKEFTSKLHPPVLGQLVETIFDKMELAGDAGTLLKIEEEIASTISRAKDEFNQEILRSKEEEGFLPGMAPKRQSTLFDFAELPDNTNFWETAEKRILDALGNYADQAEFDKGQKRLFAEDTAKGFAFIDLCRKRFDVVLMNPPFGAPADSAKGYLKKTYANHVQDLYCLFIERGIKMSLSSNVGAITSSSFLKYNDYSSFRECLLNKNLIDELLDLGWGVLDDAYVSAAAYVLSQSDTNHWIFTDYKRIEKKEEQLLSDIFAIHKGNKNTYLYFVEHQLFHKIDSSPFCYSFPADFFKWVETSKKLIDLTENNGIGAGPHNFFFRLHWEVDKEDLKVHGRWPMLPNGGQFSPYYRSNNLVIDWRQNGEFIKEHLRKKYPYLKGNVGIKIQREDMYFREGITYGKKTDRYNAQYMPRNCIPSFEGIAIYPKDNNDIMWILAYLNTRFVAYYLNLTSGLHKNSIYLDRLPLPDLNDPKKNELANRGREILKLTKTFNMLFETDKSYNREAVISQIKNFDSFKSLLLWIFQTELKIATLNEEIENLTIADIPISENIKNEIYEDQGSLYFENANDVKRQALGIPKNFGISDLLADMKSEQKFEFSNFTSKYCIPAEKIFWLQQYLLSLALGVWVDKETKGIFSLGDDTENSLDITLSNFLDMEFKGLKDFKLLEIDDRESISNNLTNNKFFEYHYKEYSASNRNAPIYWPLQTPSRSYTIWVYYHRLTAQTLYTCVNDFVDPKLKILTEDLTDLRNKSTRNSTEEKEVARLTDMKVELKDFRDELLRLAKFWQPNLNDGVQITAAPLWKLFQHRQWQQKLKETWENLEKGEYDWAHLACSIWPERVLEKCHTDRSLAIAHDVEDDFWEEIKVPVIRRGKDTGETKQEWHPRKLSGNQLRDLIQQIIETGQSSR